MPKASVVIPLYNGEKFLEEAFESVLDQSFTDFEVIVVCEYGSSEASLAILEEYARKDRRIRCLHNTEFSGISYSLNLGIENALGEYIIRMDADDICLPNRFQVQLDYMDAHPDIGICGCDVEFINESGRVVQKGDEYPLDPEQIKSDLLFFCCIRHPTVVMRKSAMCQYGLKYDLNFQAAEDYDLWCRASRYVKIANLPQVLLHYRWYRGNATHFRDREGICNCLNVMHRTFEQMGLAFTEEELRLLYPLTCQMAFSNYHRNQSVLNNCAKQILIVNEKIENYNSDCLKNTLHKRLYWIKHPTRLYIAILVRGIGNLLSRESLAAKCNNMANYLELYGLIKTIKRIYILIFVK